MLLLVMVALLALLALMLALMLALALALVLALVLVLPTSSLPLPQLQVQPAQPTLPQPSARTWCSCAQWCSSKQ
jgi:hypothetical protein